MIIFDDDGIGHNVVPMSVIEEIKAEIEQLKRDYLYNWECDEAIAIEKVQKIIDSHISGKEQQ